MPLYPHQREVIEKNPPRYLLAHGTGTGKTVTAIALADYNCPSVLVIVPKSLVKNWERALKTYSKNPGKYKIVTKEEFKRDVKILEKRDGVIVDEAHYFAGEKSMLSKALFWYMKFHNIVYRWLLTATPYLSTPMNIYMLAKHLGYDWNYYTFRKRFFYEVRMGHRMILKVRNGIEKELAQLVAQIGSAVDMESAVSQMPEIQQVPNQLFETEFFDMTNEQIHAINKLDDDNFIARWTKQHCIENGILYSDGYSEKASFLTLKTIRMLEIIQENAKVAVFCRYSGQIESLASLFIGSNKQVFVIDGSSTGEERDAIVQKAELADDAVIFIQAQCSAGYELPSFNTIIFMSMSFSYVDYSQGIGRFLRINRLSKNRYIHLVTKGVDQDVYDSIMRKEDFTLAIYGK